MERHEMLHNFYKNVSIAFLLSTSVGKVKVRTLSKVFVCVLCYAQWRQS